MDWKRYYHDEMAQPATKDYLVGLLASFKEDRDIDALVERGAILSFPHTAVHYIGPLQTRVVSSLYRMGIKRVIALGVIHTSTLPSPYGEMYRVALDGERSAKKRLEAYASLRGGFVPKCDQIDTAFGGIPCGGIAQDQAVGVCTDRTGVLKNEFSLDSFFSLVSLYAQEHAILPIDVSPLYVGMTRNPVNGSFAAAADIADLLRSMRGPDTTIVTTGDIVHYGTAYTPQEEMLDVQEEELEPFFRRECEQVLALAIEKQDLDGAFRDSNEILRSDQRYILPIIAKHFEARGQAKILSFSLSNYAEILSTERPCVVASALVAYIPLPSE